MWPAFLLTGWERVRIEPGAAPLKTLVFERYPWSHSLLLACVWGVLFALLYRAKTGYRAGAIVIAAGTRALDRTGRWAFWGFVAVLVLLYVASVLSPPPPNVPALAVGGLTGLVFPFWSSQRGDLRRRTRERSTS